MVSDGRACRPRCRCICLSVTRPCARPASYTVPLRGIPWHADTIGCSRRCRCIPRIRSCRMPPWHRSRTVPRRSRILGTSLSTGSGFGCWRSRDSGLASFMHRSCIPSTAHRRNPSSCWWEHSCSSSFSSAALRR